jgi:hypothetical protein
MHTVRILGKVFKKTLMKFQGDSPWEIRVLVKFLQKLELVVTVEIWALSSQTSPEGRQKSKMHTVRFISKVLREMLPKFQGDRRYRI